MKMSMLQLPQLQQPQPQMDSKFRARAMKTQPQHVAAILLSFLSIRLIQRTTTSAFQLPCPRHVPGSSVTRPFGPSRFDPVDLNHKRAFSGRAWSSKSSIELPELTEEAETAVASSSTSLTTAQPIQSASTDANNNTAAPAKVTNLADVVVQDERWATTTAAEEYQRGLWTIGFCTLVFASLSPAMHAALSSSSEIVPCPVVLLNAAVSVVALISLTLAGPYLEALIPPPSTLVKQKKAKNKATTASAATSTFPLVNFWDSINISTKAGMELGFWKFLGTVANLYGLSMTTADHGAFLIQLTTLIVPVVQGIMGVPIPQRIQVAVVLALSGVALFTQDMGGAAAAAETVDTTTRLWGDGLCVVAAGFYATYDLRLFAWGKQVAARPLITTKIGVQALLSVLLLAAVGVPETLAFVHHTTEVLIAGDASDSTGLMLFLLQLGAIVLWSGVMVNAMVPFLQVGGQQAIGATRAQTVYASQPLWAAIMSFFFLGETVGTPGLVGGGAFLSALFLAATAKAPDPECGVAECEI
ncbi:hypothetical protein ACA910_010605 [Epithemia clementina (nom. ined.)]